MKTHDHLLEKAKSAQANSHSPYSQFKVGAAVLMEDGQVYSGCNVENASYGATICAERVAITKAISEGSRQIKELLVISPTENAIPPCGICLQFISEFATDQTRIHLCNQKEEITSYSLKDLAPHQFSSKDL